MTSQRRDVSAALGRWDSEGLPSVLASVISTTDSAPRGLGAQLAVTVGDQWTGGLSGGCAEVVVLDEARKLLADSSADARHRAVLMSMTRDDLGNAGPVCGATLGVLIERVNSDLLDHLAQVLNGAQAGLITHAHRLYSAASTVDADDDSRPRDFVRSAAVVMTGTCGPETDRRAVLGSEVTTKMLALEEVSPPPPRLILGGGGDIATELLMLAARTGWRTVLVDPRHAFVSQSLAVAVADVVVESWPDEAFASLDVGAFDACIAVAHDEKIDLPFLRNALASTAFYVGAVGSRAVQRERRAALSSTSDPARLGALHGPAGLDLGGSGAAEIALSIAAEIVAIWNRRGAAALRDTVEPIRAS